MLEIILALPICLYILWSILLIFAYLFANKNSITNADNQNVSISVIIPFRNEALRIPTLLEYLNKQDNLENIELIFIDDNSEDLGFYIVNKWINQYRGKAKLYKLESSLIGKKNAISLGISKSEFSWILTLDADVFIDKTFFTNISKQIVQNKEFYIVPVVERNQGMFISVIESYIISIITYVTAKHKQPILASGACLLFKKELFLKFLPFNNNEEIISGDDMFFLEQVVNNKINTIKVISIKQIKVKVTPPKSYLEFINTSLRRSKKMLTIKLPKTKIIGALVLLANLSLLILLFISILTNNYNNFIILILNKFIVDFILLLLAINIYGEWVLLLKSILLAILYPFHLLLMIIFLIFTKTSWKGRRV